MTIDSRLAAICDLSVPVVREFGGRHEYDGVIQDLSPDGVRRGLARLGGDRYDDPYDEAHATAAEHGLWVRLGELELHRVNPVWHLDNLELAGYEREYAAEPVRRSARAAHLESWPEAVDAAVTALDRVPAPVAAANLPLAMGLRAQLGPADGESGVRAAAAVDRLVGHLEHAATDGDPDAALGGDALARLLSSLEAIDVDLEVLAKEADAERDRVLQLLAEACHRIDPSAPVTDTVRSLQAEHPAAGEVLAATRELVAEVIAWTASQELVPYTDGECRVGPMPESQRRALAGMFWSAPGEPEGPSWFRVTLPDPSWPAADQQGWLASGFNAMVLPNIAIHEVAPGHFSHSRALRRAGSEVRRTLQSDGFIEGWAHYCEELALEQGFRAGDPRHAVGVALDALRRLTRFSCAIGVHTGEMSLAEAADRFRNDALLSGEAAAAEARRALFDPTYGRYTWGKLVIRRLRDRAREHWGPAFTLLRFHTAMLHLGAPPLGLLDHAVPRV